MKQKAFILVCLFFICEANLYSQIVNEGTLQIKPSTIVYFGEEYTNKSTATHTNDGNLYLNNNFINNGTTASISGTTFFTSSTNTVQSISGVTKNINFYNLEVNLSSVGKQGVSVEDNFGLYVKNQVNLVSGDLRLVGEAQLVQENIVSNSGTGKLLKDQQGVASAFGYNHWSSPVNNSGTYKLSEILYDGTDAAKNPFTPQKIGFNTGSPYNGTVSVLNSGDVITPLNINDRWLYKYTSGDGTINDWIKITKDTPLNPAEGYIMKGTDEAAAFGNLQNYVFKGLPNNGTYSFPITTGQNTLFGNPYPSAIDATKFIDDNDGVFGEIYIWVDGGSTSHYVREYVGGYAIRNKLTGIKPTTSPAMNAGLGLAASYDAPGQYIAVGQGFWVDAVADGNVVFQNSQRAFVTENTSASNFYKNSASKTAEKITTEDDRSIIFLNFENPEGYIRHLALGFIPNSNADLGFNLGYDSKMFDANVDELFFIIENDITKKYVIQGVGAFDADYEFPLGVLKSKEGNYTIEIDSLYNFDHKIYLKDNLLNTTHNLKEGKFTIDIPPGEYFDRFSLVFKGLNEELVIEEEEQESIIDENIIAYYDKNYSVNIQNKGEKYIKSISIFNTLGQQVIGVSKNLLLKSEISIPFNFPKGMYIVRITSELGVKSVKFLN